MRNWDVANFSIEEICQRFRERFNHLKHKPIVIYGTGAYAQILIERMPIDGFNFTGIIDDKLTGHIVYGLPVFPLSQVAQNAKDVILTTSQTYLHVAYLNICSLEAEGVHIYYPNGELQVRAKENKAVFSYQEESELCTTIEKHDVISFDIFDTLIMRKTLIPEAAFEWLEAKLGIPGFADLRQNMSKYIEGDLASFLTIQQIYCYIKKAGILSVDTNMVMQAEIEMEHQITTVRKKMCQILDYAKKIGKKVILTSDMYYTTDIMESLLHRHGIYHYDHMYISCEQKAKKKDGSIWNKIVSDYKNSKILHIDDNKLVDTKIMRDCHVNLFSIPSSRVLLDYVNNNLLHLSDSYSDSIALGMFAVRQMNNPFIISTKQGKPEISSCFDLGYLIFGPLTYLFINWIASMSISNGEDILLFLSRDGYIWEKLYQLFIKRRGLKAPGSIYFLTSRRASMGASMKNISDIRNVLYKTAKTRSMKIMDIIREFFGVALHEDAFNSHYYYEISDDELIDYICDNCVEQILSHSIHERNNYMNYVDKLDILQYSNIGVVDFYSGGSAQMHLQNILEKPLSGYYFANQKGIFMRQDRLDLSRVYTLYGQPLDYNDSTYCLPTVCALAEVVFSSADGQFMYFTPEGAPVYGKPSGNFDKVSLCHRGIETYFDEMITLGIEPCGLELADNILGELCSKRYQFSDNIRNLFHLPDVDNFNKLLRL